MKEQLYGRGGNLYYWSYQDGEVCVNLKQETPSLITLWDCETDQSFKGFRRGSKMWNKIQAIIDPPESRWGRLKRSVQQLDAGPVESIYERDGKARYWNIKDGERSVRLQQDADGIHVLIGKGLGMVKESFLIDDRQSPLWREAVATGMILRKKTSLVGGGGGDASFVGAINPRKHKPKTAKKRGKTKQRVNVRSLVAKALK